MLSLDENVVPVGALVVMVSFVLIPHRHRYWRLPAALAWVLVWIDNRFTGSWPDYIGLGIVVATLTFVGITGRQARAGRQPR